MNTRQRKVAILREMKALKREYNRLSQQRSNSQLKRNTTRKKYLPMIKENNARDKLDNHYYKMGNRDAFYNKDNFWSEVDALNFGRSIGVSIFDDMKRNKIDFDNAYAYRESYMNGLQDGFSNSYGDPGAFGGIEEYVDRGIGSVFAEYEI